MGEMLWIDRALTGAESSLAVRDAMTKGTVKIGRAVGDARGATAIGAAESANRSAVFVMPRVGMVRTDPLGKSWR